MDSVSVTASGRHKNELTKRQKCKEGEDMISNLPDFIIGRILSALSTKEAVRTSVLSKRWIYLWTLITELHFDDTERFSFKKIRKTCFLNSVYRVLLHLNSASIESFSLRISEKYDPYHINQWISAVSSRRVKQICVDSRKQRNVISCYSLFKCLSLACLSSLTVLKLSEVTFTSYSSNDSKKLTLNFPVLRKYETKYCTWSGVKSVTFEVPLLEVLLINRVCSRSDESHTEIKFCASRLTKFRYCGNMSSETILLAAHIASAEISLDNFRNSVQETFILACKLLSNNAKCLKLELYPPAFPGVRRINEYNEVLALVKGFFAGNTAFGMLCCLELNSVTGEFLLGFLSKSPCLKTLVFEKLLDFDEELQNSVIVPECFSSTLKVVKFGGLDGDVYELCFSKFVMENAQFLERISFSCGQKLRGSNLEKVKEKLISFKKSLSFSIIEFSSV